MATYEKTIEALRRADAAGNVEDAKRLASMANSLKPKSSQGVSPFINKAMAETFGAPVDLVTAGLSKIPGVNIEKPFMGSESIKSGMGSVGIPVADRKAETIPENIGSTLGETAAFILPIGKATQVLSKGAGITGNIAKSIMSTMAKHPYFTMGSEVTGAIGAGLGRGASQDSDSTLVKSGAEIAGGIAGSVTPSAIIHTPSAYVLRAGKNFASKAAGALSKEGSLYRAGTFAKKQTPSPDATITELSSDAISNLPPAVKANEKRITSLYKALIEKDPVLEADAVSKISKAATDLESDLRKMGYGSPDALAAITEKRIASLELSMDKRTVDAMESAQKKLEKIPVAKRQSAESQIVRNELKNVMTQERQKLNQLWSEVPKETTVPFDKTRSRYSELLQDISEAQRVDIPAPLKKSSILLSEELTETNVREMQGLRSKLLEVSRQSRKDGKWNKSRIAEEMSDAILEDLGAAAIPTTPEGAKLKTALNATRHFKTRFESGITGKILGYSKSGAPAIDPSLTLDISIGRAGARGAVDLDNVVVTQEAREATERYLARSFTDYSMDKDALSPIKVERWIKSNEDILDQFPELRAKITDASQAQDLANQTKATMDARKSALRRPEVSAAAKFLKANDVNKEIDTVLKSKDPVSTTRQLVRMAKNDTTGEALEGLKAGFVDNILNKSQMGGFNQLGQRTLSGNAMSEYINQNNAVLRQVFSGEQMGRMRTIAKELTKIEKFEAARAGKADIEMDDFVSSTLETMSRVAGAKVGGLMGASSPGGSLQLAQMASGRFRKYMNFFSKNRAERLVIDAVLSDDPELLKALLKPIGKPGTKTFESNLDMVTKRMNAWLAGTGADVYLDVEEDMRYQEPTETKSPDVSEILNSVHSRYQSGTLNPEHIRVYDELKRRGYFSQKQRIE